MRRPLLASTTLALVLAGVAVGTPAQAVTAASSSASASPHQSAVDDAFLAYRAARDKVAAVGAQSARLATLASEAEAQATTLADLVEDRDPGVLSALADLVSRGESDLDRAQAAAEDAAAARELADYASQALADSIEATEQARLAWERATAEVGKEQTAEAALEAAATATRQSRFRAAYEPATKAEDARNHKALRRWHRHLSRLADATVVPPAAGALQRPDKLRDGLDPVRASDGDRVPGVAEVDRPGTAPVTVLPAETVRAVAEAFSQVGLEPDQPVADYTCGGFVARSWSVTTRTVPADAVGQAATLHHVPRSQAQTGDVVVLGTRDGATERSGIYLGDDLMLAPDLEDGRVAVERIETRDYAVRRVTLPASAEPVGTTGCGTDLDTTDPQVTPDGDGPLTWPLAPGTFEVSAHYGQTGPLWASGVHTGQDFSAAIGTPVHAAAAGVVTVEHPDWAGNLVRIDHGGGVETTYAHLSEVAVEPGEQVEPGQLIGAVGSEGNSTGAHLHLELLLDGTAVDPMLVLSPEAPTAANGELPLETLCSATPDGVQSLRCDAAVAFRLMAAAFERETGVPLCITDSYRSRDGQEQVYETKPTLAAVPGTSNHGWGTAVDLCGGVERFDTAEHAWVVEHGPSYGWIHPSWAAAGGSRPEAWHFEYLS